MPIMDMDIIVVVAVAEMPAEQFDSASSEEREDTGGDNATHGAAGQ
jgi:hypothetical protein